MIFAPFTFIRIDKLRSGVSREHVNDDHLAPLIDVDQKGTQLPVILVDEVDSVGAHFLESGNDGA